MTGWSWLDAGGKDGLPELLWEDGERRFCRIWREGADGVRHARLAVLPAPEHPAAAITSRLAHEYALKDDLDGAWALRPLELVREGGQMALVLDYHDGRPLDRLIGPPMEIGRFLRLAVAVANSLSGLHGRGLIHKDVKPANVLVDAAGQQVWLTGFGVASRLPRERQVPAPPETIAGTLAYMAPEQTGRMNRSIDARSDLYALGVTLHEMLTGSLPFTASDPMEWVHCHIARQPLPPRERMPHVPVTVSAMIVKLLAKTAEERYQTAAGLERDLRRCLAQFEAEGRVDDFAPGEHDTPDRLMIPETLFGRTRELESLLAAFDRVITGGPPELVLVSGYSGIGKSSVVNELHKVLVPPRGLFAAGKFDQYKRDIPYATLAQVFQSLVRPLLAKSEEELGCWRHALRDALGPNGQLIANLIPELELVIGKQPPVPDLPPQDARNRFQMVFRAFLRVFARSQHPLVLFLDDLQWIDAATLALVEDLVGRHETRHLLLIGAYRDNEVGPTHPLGPALDALRAAGTRINAIVLSALDLDDVCRLIASALHSDEQPVRPLAHLVFDKTGGNPFFTIQFLTELAAEALLSFDAGHAVWNWDVARIRAKGYTDHIAQLMVVKLTRLPAAAQEALQELACLGNSADFATLAIVRESSQAEIDRAFRDAAQAGLVIRLERGYRFAHDRVHEAAYALIPPALRPQLHLRLGRRLRAASGSEPTAERIFAVVTQLNHAVELIPGADEKMALFRLNVLAGMNAKAGIAYGAARNYLAQAAALVAADAWTRCYGEVLELYLGLAECEYLVGNVDSADKLFELMLGRAVSDLDRARIYSLRIKVYQAGSRYDESVVLALEALQLFGVTFPESDDEIQATADAEFRAVTANLGGRRIGDLIDATVADAPEVRAIIDLLVDAAPGAYNGRPKLFPLVTMKAVNFSLRYGNTDQSSYAYAVHALTLVSVYDDPAQAFEFSEMALRLNERFDNARLRGTLLHLHGDHVNFWRRHFATGVPILEQGFRACLEVGDLVYAGHLAFLTVWQEIERGVPLAEVCVVATRNSEFARQSHIDAVHQTIELERQFVASLQGRTSDPLAFDAGGFDERASLATIEQSSFGCGVVFHRIMKQMLAFLYGRHAEALDAARFADPMLGAARALPIEATHHFYHALTLTALYPGAPRHEQARFAGLLEGTLKKLKLWADNCPQNYHNRYALVLAEIARIEGRPAQAMDLYEEAIRSARENGFIQQEALAFELAATFYAARGFATFAHAYLRKARDGYLRWGADGKVRQLDERYPHLTDQDLRPDRAATVETTLERLDLAVVLNVLEAVSGETDLERLIATVMRLGLTHAGAERGLLVLPRDDGYRIEAEAKVGSDGVTVALRQSPITVEDLPASAFHYVRRTTEAVLLHDASADNPFSDDGYIRRHRARSVLCMPLLKQTRLVGVIYFENNLTSGAFTPGRVALLELLASEAAISLENAQLYRHLQERERESRMIVDSIPGLVATLEASGGVDVVNKRMLEYFGKTSAELKQWHNVIHPDDLPRIIQIFTQAMASGDPHEYEVRLQRFDGVYRWFRLRGMPLRDATARVVRWYVLITDIDDLRRAEDVIRRSERNLTLIINTIPALAWSAQTDGRAEFFNQHYLDYLGLSAEEANDWGWSNAVHPDDLNSLVGVWQRCMASDAPGEAEARLRRFDGEYRWFLFRVNPLRDDSGKTLRWYGTNTDIDDRKRAEAELRRAYDHLAEAQRLSLTGSFTSDLVTGTHYWSDELYRICEFEPGSAITIQRLGEIVHPEDLPLYEGAIQRAVASTEPEFYFRILTPAGVVKHLRGLAHRIPDRPVFVGAVQDVTAARIAEDALNKASSELAHVARVATLNTLTASIAHEINQPLSGIITNAETCQMMLDANPPNIDGARETARRTIRDGHRASAVVTRLRALFSKREFTLEPLDLNEATREVLALSSSDLQRNRAIVQSELADDLPTITGDRIQLQQVILNLLRNASDAMAGVHDRPRQLLIRTEREDGDRVRVTVRDAGTGFNRESTDSLFEAFYTTKRDGMGIGLSVSRSIVERHRGRLWAEPNDGPGATFAFSIPCNPESVTEAAGYTKWS